MKPATHKRRSTGLTAALLLLPCSPLQADDCAPQGSRYLPTNVSSIRLIYGTDISTSAMDAARAKWNDCSQTLPELRAPSETGDLDINFEYRDERAPAGVGCGETDFDTTWNQSRGVWELAGGRIVTYREASNGASCIENPDRRERTYAHEMGHVLNLQNGVGDECEGRIMGPPSATSSLDELKFSDCESASEATSPSAASSNSPQSENTCVDDDCEPGSPILISITDSRYVLTSINQGVLFDLDADGIPELTAWVAAESDDAFLVLDRDGNGRIDNGFELFGNYTPQPPSHTPNGFAALGEFDDPLNGGNGDGRIDTADAVFLELRLWIDQNKNGLSEADELFTLESCGLEYIDLDYSETRRVDPFGNEFRFRSKVGRRHGVVMAWDVFFLHD